MKRRLFVLRHAKSSWKNSEMTDFDRPLNKRGRRDLPAMAARFAQQHQVDLLVTSPAERARETAKGFAEALDLPKGRFREELTLYEATPSVLIERVRGLPDKARSVLLVGHDPGVSRLLEFCSGEVVEKLPTCAWRELVFSADHWADIEAGGARLRALHSPKEKTGH